MNLTLESAQVYSIYRVETGIELYPTQQAQLKMGRLISLHGSYKNAYQYGNKLAQREKLVFVNHVAAS